MPEMTRPANSHQSDGAMAIERVVDAQSRARQQDDPAPAEAIRQRSEDRREHELHRREDAAEQAVDRGAPRRVSAAEVHDQARQDGNDDPERQHVDDDGDENEGKRSTPGSYGVRRAHRLRLDRLPGTQRGERGVIRGVDPVHVGGRHAQVAQLPVLQAVDPSVDRKRLAARPGLLDDRGLADVTRLLDDVQLAEAIDLRRECRRWARAVADAARTRPARDAASCR